MDQQHKPWEYSIRLMLDRDIEEVGALITSVFNTHVSPGYTQAGCDEFYKFTNVAALKSRWTANNATFVAADDEHLVGVVEVRPPNHISLLFVDSEHQHSGIGRNLFARACIWITNHAPTTQYVSVNASPNAQEAYAHWGFTASHPEQEHNGIRFIPMLYHIQSEGET